MPALQEVLTRQLHYVCGKGGVGKSVVACALARGFHDEGKSVLLVQVNAADSHARLLDSAPVGAELQEIERGFTVVNATPAAAMKEYALMTLRFEALYRTVFENRLTKAFLRFLPSLPELTIQGKIWHHAEERDDGRARFERIVVDCPSTGHGLKFLRVARVIADASRVGPMAEKTRLMHAVVEDPRRTALHVVALPEELPVNEARDLVEQVRTQRIAPLGAVFLNQRLPRLFDDASERALETARSRGDDLSPSRQALAQLFEVADRRRGRERLEAEMRARLETLGMPLIELPMLLAAPPGPRDIERFAALVKDTAAGQSDDGRG